MSTLSWMHEWFSKHGSQKALWQSIHLSSNVLLQFGTMQSKAPLCVGGVLCWCWPKTDSKEFSGFFGRITLGAVSKMAVVSTVSSVVSFSCIIVSDICFCMYENTKIGQHLKQWVNEYLIVKCNQIMFCIDRKSERTNIECNEWLKETNVRKILYWVYSIV